MTQRGMQTEMRALDALRNYLSEVPFVQPNFDSSFASSPLIADSGVDGLVTLRFPMGEVALGLIIKTSGEVGTVREAALRLRAWRNRMVHLDTPMPFLWPYGVFAAPYLSPRAALVCRDQGIGYFDFAGNCFLSFGQVHIHRENWPNPDKPAQRSEPASLWGTKATRILRVLLENVGTAWKTQSLSEVAGTSVGLISNVRGQLSDREWVRDTPDGFRLIEPESLLLEWARHSVLKKRTIHSFYSLDDARSIEQKVSEWGRFFDVPAALTEYSGASRIAPYTRYSQVAARIGSAGLKMLTDQGFKRSESGANLRVIETEDDGVFYGMQWRDGIPIVCDTQLYLDLRALGGRGNDAAEYLLDTVLKKRWKDALQGEPK